MSETLEARVERLEKTIAQMQPKSEQWVGATIVTRHTGWNSEDLRKARRNGAIQYKIKSRAGKTTYKYLLSSIVK